jgi:hypothetical protein
MRRLTRLRKAGVERLWLLAGAGVTVVHEELSPGTRERDKRGALTIEELGRQRHQPLASKVFQVAMPPVAGTLGFEISGVSNPERTDEGQRPDLRPSECHHA